MSDKEQGLVTLLDEYLTLQKRNTVIRAQGRQMRNRLLEIRLQLGDMRNISSSQESRSKAVMNDDKIAAKARELCEITPIEKFTAHFLSERIQGLSYDRAKRVKNILLNAELSDIERLVGGEVTINSLYEKLKAGRRIAVSKKKVLKRGDTVFHKEYGRGKLVAISKYGHLADVMFAIGTKKVFTDMLGNT